MPTKKLSNSQVIPNDYSEENLKRMRDYASQNPDEFNKKINKIAPDEYRGTRKLASMLIQQYPERFPNATADDVVNVLNQIAHVETGDKNIKQMNNGPGRGYFQVELSTAPTALKRYQNYQNILNPLSAVPLPNSDLNINNLNKKGSTADVMSLSKDEQAMLALSNISANAKKTNGVINVKNPMDVWINYHWAGSPSQKAERESHWKQIYPDNFTTQQHKNGGWVYPTNTGFPKYGSGGKTKRPTTIYQKGVGAYYNPISQNVYIDPQLALDPAISQHEYYHHAQNLAGNLQRPELYPGPLNRPQTPSADIEQQNLYYNRKPIEESELTNRFLSHNPTFNLVDPDLVYDQAINPKMYNTPTTAEGEARAYEDSLRSRLIKPRYRKGGYILPGYTYPIYAEGGWTGYPDHTMYSSAEKQFDKVKDYTKYAEGGEVWSIMKSGGMLKRADGSYSKRGLWDNIRANKGSGKKPTPKMLEQESKIRAMEEHGGRITTWSPGEPVSWHHSTIGEKMGSGGYTVKRSSARKGKTHVVIGPGGTKKYFGDSHLGQHPNNPARKKSFYARHKHNLAKNPYFRAFARATWKDGGYTLNPAVYGPHGNINPYTGMIHVPEGYGTPAYNERNEFSFGGDIGAGFTGLVGGALGTIPGIGGFLQQGVNKLDESIQGPLTNEEKSVRGYAGAAGAIGAGLATGNVSGAISGGASGLAQGISAGSPKSKTAQDLATGLNIAGTVGGMAANAGAFGKDLGSNAAKSFKTTDVGKLTGNLSEGFNTMNQGINPMSLLSLMGGQANQGSPLESMVHKHGGAVKWEIMADGGETKWDANTNPNLQVPQGYFLNPGQYKKTPADFHVYQAPAPTTSQRLSNLGKNAAKGTAEPDYTIETMLMPMPPIFKGSKALLNSATKEGENVLSNTLGKGINREAQKSYSKVDWNDVVREHLSSLKPEDLSMPVFKNINGKLVRVKTIKTPLKKSNFYSYVPGLQEESIPKRLSFDLGLDAITPIQEKLGNVADIAESKQLENYGLKTNVKRPKYQRKLDTDLIKYNNHYGTNLYVQHPSPTEADFMTGSTDIPNFKKFNEKLNSLKTSAVYGKTPTETNIMIKGEMPVSKGLATDFIGSQRFKEAPRYPGSEAEIMPVNTKDLFQYHTPNKKGGTVKWEIIK